MSLKDIQLPSTLTGISKGCFDEAISLTSVVVPENVSTIDSHAFCSCSSLKQVTLPASLTAIGDSVFSNDKALDTFTMHCSVPPTLGKDVFPQYTAKLIVPAGAAEAYRNHDIWGRFATITEEE